MNAELLHRREELLRQMVRGVSLKEAVTVLTKDIVDLFEREKQIRAIRKDWGNRERWIANVVRLNEGTFLTELIAGMEEAMRCCWVVYANAKSAENKIKALRTIIAGKTRVGFLLLKVGIIQAAPQHIESTMTIIGTPFDCDPELRKALLEEAERQREIKNQGEEPCQEPSTQQV